MPAQAQDRAQAEQVLRGLFDQLNTAYQQKDLATFEKILHDKYFYTYNLKVGELNVGKASHMQSLQKLAQTTSPPSLIQFDRESVIFYSPNVAMTLYDVYSKPSGPSAAQVTKVAKWFVKSGDSWQLVYEWRAPKPQPR
jgi:hypothetical protein